MIRRKITVAIPVYNAAKYLEVTLDSLRHQTMDLDDFEVICVNDCSTDNSKEIIENYSKMMGNIVLIDRTENSGGPVVPRNNAIDAAQGEYIHFLDNDDFLGEETLERLYYTARANSSDVIYGRYISVNGSGPSVVMFKNGNRPKADIIADNLVYSLTPHKMFRLSFLKEQGFKFDPKANAGNDDQLFLLQCYVAAKVITVMADYPYYFVVGRGKENLSSNYVPAKKWLFVWHQMMKFLNEAIQNEQYKKRIKVALLNRLFVRTRFRSFLLTSRTTREQKIEWLNETKRFIDAHMNDQLIQSLNPRFHPFWHAAKENDIDKLAKLSLENKPLQKRNNLKIVKIKQANAVSYKRPSVKAIGATTYKKAGQVITVYSIIKGWFEIRRVEQDGVHFAGFIQRKDVRYTIIYLVSAIIKKIKSRLTKLLKRGQ